MSCSMCPIFFTELLELSLEAMAHFPPLSNKSRSSRLSLQACRPTLKAWVLTCTERLPAKCLAAHTQQLPNYWSNPDNLQ